MKTLIKILVVFNLLSIQQIRAEFEVNQLSQAEMDKAIAEEQEALERLEGKLFRTKVYEKTVTVAALISAIASSYRLKNTFNMKRVYFEAGTPESKIEKLRHELELQKGIINYSKYKIFKAEHPEKLQVEKQHSFWSEAGNDHVVNFRKFVYTSVMINSIILAISQYYLYQNSSDAIIDSETVVKIKDAIHLAKSKLQLLKEARTTAVNTNEKSTDVK